MDLSQWCLRHVHDEGRYIAKLFEISKRIHEHSQSSIHGLRVALDLTLGYLQVLGQELTSMVDFLHRSALRPNARPLNSYDGLPQTSIQAPSVQGTMDESLLL